MNWIDDVICPLGVVAIIAMLSAVGLYGATHMPEVSAPSNQTEIAHGKAIHCPP